MGDSKIQSANKIVKSKKNTNQEKLRGGYANNIDHLRSNIRLFFSNNWKGFLVIFLATAVFFWPLIIHAPTYSVGGDSMFNAWTLARDQHCILRQNCPNYVDGNIFFPHKDTMLYSETQLSAGLLTLPLYFINQNPLFSNNVWTVISYFLMGFFMYLLAKHLSKGRELVSIAAGLTFAFAPFQMAATWHLQNLSIFYLPLAVLLVLNYIEKQKNSYLWALFITLVLLCYSSWYQMVFGLTVVGIICVGQWLLKRISPKILLNLGAVIALSLLTATPLAYQYVKFSKENGASFGVSDQLLYASSVQDYVIPHNGTIAGKLYYHLNPGAQVNAYNLDSFSYHSLTLYAVAIFVIIMAIRYRDKKDNNNSGLVIILAFIALVGFFASLGPLLQIKGSYIYGSIAGTHVSVVAPYAIVDKLLPQLHFIRAVGRWSVLVLFSLCCLLALLPECLSKLKISPRALRSVLFIVILGLVFELAPVHFVTLSNQVYANSFSVPKVYTFIKKNKQIDNILVIDGNSDYPNAKISVEQAEWALWAGYDNKNTFNGYSGYVPPNFMNQYIRFKDNLPGSLNELRSLGIKYVLIDKYLSTERPTLIRQARDSLSGNLIYTDSRYDLYKIPDSANPNK